MENEMKPELTLAQELRQTRAILRWTQLRLARELGCNSRSIGLWEGGGREPVLSGSLRCHLAELRKSRPEI